MVNIMNVIKFSLHRKYGRSSLGDVVDYLYNVRLRMSLFTPINITSKREVDLKINTVIFTVKPLLELVNDSYS